MNRALDAFLLFEIRKYKIETFESCLLQICKISQSKYYLYNFSLNNQNVSFFSL